MYEFIYINISSKVLLILIFHLYVFFTQPNVHGLGSIPLPNKNAAHVNKIYIYGGTGLSDLR